MLAMNINYMWHVKYLILTHLHSRTLQSFNNKYRLKKLLFVKETRFSVQILSCTSAMVLAVKLAHFADMAPPRSVPPTAFSVSVAS